MSIPDRYPSTLEQVWERFEEGRGQVRVYQSSHNLNGWGGVVKILDGGKVEWVVWSLQVEEEGTPSARDADTLNKKE